VGLRTDFPQRDGNLMANAPATIPQSLTQWFRGLPGIWSEFSERGRSMAANLGLIILEQPDEGWYGCSSFGTNLSKRFGRATANVRHLVF
jgi:hypothetical protein